MKKLENLRQDKASGADDIQPRYLKEIAEEICHPLTVIPRYAFCGIYRLPTYPDATTLVLVIAIAQLPNYAKHCNETLIYSQKLVESLLLIDFRSAHDKFLNEYIPEIENHPTPA